MFLEPPELDVREHHLRVTHRLTACANKADIYHDTDLFHDHLETELNATISHWTRKLLRTCIVGNRSNDVVIQTTSVATHEDPWQDEDDAVEAAVEAWEDTALQTTGEAFVSGLWDSALLGEWSSSRDRINRWMLHMLGADATTSDVLKTIYQEEHRQALDIPSKTWSRLVLKYWFIDEAAVGFELNAAAAANLTLGELDLKDSSLHLSARPSGTKSDDIYDKNARQNYYEDDQGYYDQSDGHGYRYRQDGGYYDGDGYYADHHTYKNGYYDEDFRDEYGKDYYYDQIDPNSQGLRGSYGYYASEKTNVKTNNIPHIGTKKSAAYPRPQSSIGSRAGSRTSRVGSRAGSRAKFDRVYK